ncbi:MAG: type 1 glutamine amidotransferase [Rhodothermales bacterium]|nr:type 1 glutamine amidotransferase [Rhodothermales bacterium]
MAPDHDSLRVRLLQVRERAAVRAEELESFRERCRLRPDQVLSTDVLTEPLDAGLLDGVDAVFIGGAGAYSVTRTYPFTAPLIRLLHASAERAIPTFGSCWGHQFLARAFGGEVVFDPDRSEMGTHAVRLTEAGQDDPLFGTLPQRFYAQMGHQDRVARLPDGAVELASNEVAPFQAFRLADVPVYGTQFHSELTAERERQRLITYQAYYSEVWDEGEFERTLASLRETPEIDGLLYAFLQHHCVEATSAFPR